jgi:hypothetical protein
MKLDSLYYIIPVAESHNHSVFSLSGDFKAGRHSFCLDYEGVIASAFERVGKTGEDCFTIVINEGCLTMYWSMTNNISAIDMANALVSQTDT